VRCKDDGGPPPRERERLSKLKNDYISQAKQCRDFIRLLPGMGFLSDEQQADLQQKAEAWVKEASAGASDCAQALEPDRFYFRCLILLAWEIAGGTIQVSLPYKSKEEVHYPEPKTEFVRFYLAAAREILDEQQSGHTVRRLPERYRRLNFRGAALTGAGGLFVNVTQVAKT
jgi:hypothetical protein